LPAPHEVIALDAAKLNGYAGRYLVNSDRVITVKNENGKLMAYPTTDRSFEILPISETTFVRRDLPWKYKFERNGTNGAGSGGGDGEPTATAFTVLQIMGFDNNVVDAKRINAETLVPFELLMSGKIDEGRAAYRKLKQEKPNDASVSEDRLNNVGYALMRAKKVAEAIAIFKLNTELYPDAWNTYDSLGEAYAVNGDKELAIASYKKSIALNPKNGNGVAALKKLEDK
jgi:tetratricopeptide (TPR) repeat protein